MRNIAYLTGLCFALACSSCNRDRLYYAMEEQGFVRLNVNWQPTQLNPNGMQEELLRYPYATYKDAMNVFVRQLLDKYGCHPTRWTLPSPWENSTCW